LNEAERAIDEGLARIAKELAEAGLEPTAENVSAYLLLENARLQRENERLKRSVVAGFRR
jgi:hypothetical protein